MSARFLDAAATQESHERFIRRAVEHQAVWTVWGETGPLVAESQESDDEADQDEARDVYLFFSDEVLARRALRQSWSDMPGASVREIPLFDLIYRWLPGMHQDDHLAGTNWTGDLIGREVEPADLQSELEEHLPEEVQAEFRRRLEAGPR